MIEKMTKEMRVTFECTIPVEILHNATEEETIKAAVKLANVAELDGHLMTGENVVRVFSKDEDNISVPLQSFLNRQQVDYLADLVAHEIGFAKKEDDHEDRSSLLGFLNPLHEHLVRALEGIAKRDEIRKAGEKLNIWHQGELSKELRLLEQTRLNREKELGF